VFKIELSDKIVKKDINYANIYLLWGGGFRTSQNIVSGIMY